MSILKNSKFCFGKENKNLLNLSNEKHSNSSLDQINNDINNLWILFTKAFDFENFYKEDFNINGKLNDYTRLNSLKKWNEFCIKYRITYTEDLNLKYDNEFNSKKLTNFDNKSKKINISYILKSSKVWIMYILVMNQALDLQNIIKIFKNSLKNNVDSVFMFEFFLIFMTKLNKESYKEMIVLI